jgi:hypothetical protein
MESTLRSISTDDRAEGACADAENTVEKINGKTTIEQSLRHRFSFGLIVRDNSDRAAARAPRLAP